MTIRRAIDSDSLFKRLTTENSIAWVDESRFPLEGWSGVKGTSLRMARDMPLTYLTGLSANDLGCEDPTNAQQLQNVSDILKVFLWKADLTSRGILSIDKRFAFHGSGASATQLNANCWEYPPDWQVISRGTHW